MSNKLIKILDGSSQNLPSIGSEQLKAGRIFITTDFPNEAIYYCPEDGRIIQLGGGIGKETINGGEIFSDYINNKALSEYSTALGENNVAGLKCFIITAIDANAKTYTLDSVNGLAIDDEFSVIMSKSVINAGKIIAIDTQNNIVTTDIFAGNSLMTSDTNYFFIKTKPEIGTQNIGNCAYAQGRDNNAFGYYSHAEGRENIVSGTNSHVEGRLNQSLGSASHAEGLYTIAQGHQSHAEGYGAIANGNYSHAEGLNTKSNGMYSHAEGSSTVADGFGTHTEGMGTYAKGNGAHAEGSNTRAEGEGAHAGGIWTATNSEGQTAIGMYNDNKTDTLFEVGNGTAEKRSNAFEVYKDGHVEVQTPGKTDNSVIIKSTFDSAIKKLNDDFSDLGTQVFHEIESPKDSIKLTDTVTKTIYKLYVANGKLQLEVVE